MAIVCQCANSLLKRWHNNVDTDDVSILSLDPRIAAI